VLEFRDVLELVASRASSALGREGVLELAPLTEAEPVRRELARVEEVAGFLDRHRDWMVPEIPDARRALERLGVEGSVLEPLDLHAVGRLLTAGRELSLGLRRVRDELPGLAFLEERLHRDEEREKRIGRIVESDGTVLDTASKELGRLRERLRRAHNRIVRALEEHLKSLPDRFLVPDASVSIREGRYVIPVRREGRREVGGVVMGESATGATLFVEPPMAQELTNEIRELEREEAREIQRILRTETEALRSHHPLLVGSQDALVAFDVLYARARTALEWRGRAPTLLAAGTEELEIVEGRHPLLLARGETEVVPFHLSMTPGERALVVSGPNTGGKSVFLKALGLVSTLAQSGIIPPVGEGTRLPVFTDVFADIGDEQSIEQDLSTFSAHLSNLKEIVNGAGPRALALIDEMGTGTDPQEGAALSRAILEELVERGTLTVVTSHLGALKQLDTPGSGVVNASLQFDPDRIEPTYHLMKGRPGRSYGLAIARRLGFPPRILDRAEEHLPREEARMEDLLAALERKEKEASNLLASLEREQEETERLREELRGREAELEARESTAETRAREEARRMLLEARQEVEEAIREVRRAGGEVSEAEGAPSLEEASHRARKRVEEAAQHHRRRAEARAGEGGEGGEGGQSFRPGDRVKLTGSGAKGEVVETRDERVMVEASGMRLQVPVEDLALLERASEKEESVERGGGGGPAQGSGGGGKGATWQGPEVTAASEIDLRGLRVAEVDLEVERAVDQAVLAGLQELRIIHGKGTGALRERVSEILSGESRVADFRMGRPAEGGAGITIARFR
jgi:DNA mismatch repair protein MutS2